MRAVRQLAMLAAAVWITACGSDTTVAAPSNNARVFLSATKQSEVPAASPAVLPAASPAASPPLSIRMGGISAESVDSVMVDILAFASIQSTDTVAYAATLPVNAITPTMRVNFRTLPRSGTDSIEIAKGRLPPGKYDAMRMRFAAATITFNTTVTSGGRTFEPGTYPLDMTHGITFAVDVPVDAFTISSGPKATAVSILFDVNSSIASLKLATDGSGHLVMNPIFTATTR